MTSFKIYSYGGRPLSLSIYIFLGVGDRVISQKLLNHSILVNISARIIDVCFQGCHTILSLVVHQPWQKISLCLSMASQMSTLAGVEKMTICPRGNYCSFVYLQWLLEDEWALEVNSLDTIGNLFFTFIMWMSDVNLKNCFFYWLCFSSANHLVYV